MYYLNTFKHLRFIIIFVNINSVQFYQLSKIIDMRNNKRMTDCILYCFIIHEKNNNFTVLQSNKKERLILQNNNTIEISDIIKLLLKKFLSSFLRLI